MDRQKIIIIMLAAGLFLSLQYVILDKWSQANQEAISRRYQAGYDQGLKDAITALYEQTNDCHGTTITFGNLTRSLFDIQCLHSNSNSSGN